MCHIFLQRGSASWHGCKEVCPQAFIKTWTMQEGRPTWHQIHPMYSVAPPGMDVGSTCLRSETEPHLPCSPTRHRIPGSSSSRRGGRKEKKKRSWIPGKNKQCCCRRKPLKHLKHPTNGRLDQGQSPTWHRLGKQGIIVSTAKIILLLLALFLLDDGSSTFRKNQSQAEGRVDREADGLSWHQRLLTRLRWRPH